MGGLHTPIPATAVHLGIDMQRMFVEDSAGPHYKLLALYHDRFAQQVETAESSEMLDGWR